MSRQPLDFDDVAADDALIESIRAGVGADELPDDDVAASLLLSLRDGVERGDEAAVTADAGCGRIKGPSRGRAVAVGVLAGTVVMGGVGAAVAGDPTAAFTYMFQRGVDMGSRLGTPDGDVDTVGSLDRIDRQQFTTVVRSVPVRQGMSAAPWSDNTGNRDPVGFERDVQYWEVPNPRGLESVFGDVEGSVRGPGRVSDVYGYDEGAAGDGSTTVPDESESPGPDDSTSPDGGDVQPTPETSTPPPDDGDVQPTPETSTPPPDDGPTTMIVPPPETTSPPPETETPPPETTSPPPEAETSPTDTASGPTASPSPSETTPTVSESPSSTITVDPTS